MKFHIAWCDSVTRKFGAARQVAVAKPCATWIYGFVRIVVKNLSGSIDSVCQITIMLDSCCDQSSAGPRGPDSEAQMVGPG
jgi:hypothetical protein